MDIHLCEFKDIPRSDELYQMFETLCEDGVKFEDYESVLSSTPVFSVYDRDVFCGFFTMEHKSPYAESHIYLLPSKRRVSVKVMKYIISITQRAGLIPMTSVTGDYPHIKRCLELLGLRVFNIKQQAVIKNGVGYDLFYLSLDSRNNE